MAAEVFDTIRLDADLTGNLPTNEYKVLATGLEDLKEPAVLTERALTGRLHIHRVMDSGDPLVFDGHRYELFLTRAELDLLKADLARTVYFMPNYRDEGAGWETYREVVFFQSLTGIRNIDPEVDYWRAVIELVESTGNTP
jgi:hypothetical protein